MKDNRMITAPAAQIPGIYHRRIGDIVVTALSDGVVKAAFEMMRGIELAEAEAILRDAFQPAPPQIQVNCFLIHSHGRVGLIDTGCGVSMGDHLGLLPRQLSRLGIDVGQIDTVMLTHMHPDHSNGLTAPDGTANFPAAELVVSETDVRHWHDDSAMSIASDRHRERFFKGARAQIRPYWDRRRDAAGEVFPGVHAEPLPGHTPGHTGYLVSSGGESLLIWGDIVHIPDVQVRRPEVCVEPDSDHAMAAATRRRTFDRVATDRLLVAGLHMHFPGFLYLRGDVQRGYEIVPERWIQDL
jgi:glyoxylase-like metal-dependent hydrolase (beta-lactamase superfamily II)